MYKLLIYLLCFCGYVIADFGVIFKGHVGSKPGWAFKGKFQENSSTIFISPELKAIPVERISKSMSICGFAIHRDMLSNFPFIVEQKFDYAEIRLNSDVEIESLKSQYAFQIEAFDCDLIPHYSERKFVVIDIKSIQRPIFTSSSYRFMAKVNTAVGTKIGSVTAFERPEKIELANNGSQGICKYSIVSLTAVPFSVDKTGSIFTKVLVLDNAVSTQYRFVVEAKNCREPNPESNSVPVTVDVFDDCEPHWKGLPSNVDYDGDTNVLPIAMNELKTPSLHLCAVSCQDLLAVVYVKLAGKDLKPAKTSLCTHDDLSLRKQERACDISNEFIDIMAMAPKNLRDPELGGYSFNGTVTVNVDSQFNTFGHGKSHKFSVMFWMRHGQMNEGGPKEQILCNSDGQDHNRHHFSLFLHNCKLILLLRKEFGEISSDKYEPSEWRFGPLIEVCDDKWHHYAVLFNNGSVVLQLDGERNEGSFQYLVDKPMVRFAAHKIVTRFSIGACYHARSNNFAQYFKGSLAALKIVDGYLERLNNIRCVATCGEALLLPNITDIADLQSSVSILSDSIVIRSRDVFNFLQMFSKLSYINTVVLSEVHANRGHVNRNVTISADIHCDGIKVSKVAPRTIVIHLRDKITKKANTPPLVDIYTNGKITGYTNERIPLFDNLKLIKRNKTIDSIQSCIVRPVGQSIRPWEYIDWPIDLIINFHLTGLNNSHGLVLEGIQTLSHYESILGKVYYVNTKSEVIDRVRKFAISCSIIGKLVADEVVVSVTLERQDLNRYYVIDEPTESPKDTNKVFQQQAKVEAKALQEKVSVPNKVSWRNKPPTIAVWVVLACLLLIIVGTMVGVIVVYRKFRNHNINLSRSSNNDHQRRRLTVIPNPMVTEGVGIGAIEFKDDDSLANDVPESEEEEFEDEELFNDDCRERITIPSFLRIPGPVHRSSVDV